jgi:hypothetical protein
MLGTIFFLARRQVCGHGEDYPNQGCADAHGALDRDATGASGAYE